MRKIFITAVMLGTAGTGWAGGAGEQLGLERARVAALPAPAVSPVVSLTDPKAMTRTLESMFDAGTPLELKRLAEEPYNKGLLSAEYAYRDGKAAALTTGFVLRCKKDLSPDYGPAFTRPGPTGLYTYEVSAGDFQFNTGVLFSAGTVAHGTGNKVLVKGAVTAVVLEVRSYGKYVVGRLEMTGVVMGAGPARAEGFFYLWKE